MADKAISQLNAATSVTSVDLFVLEQSGEAKKLTGQILENWLVSFADGHGGIQSITKTGSTGTNPVIDTYTILLADETTTTFQVVNGIKGDTGDQTYVWIRYAHTYPTADSDMGTSPDEWIGIYSGTSTTAPTHYTDYTWYQFKGETGDTGAAATITAATVGYQQSDSGSVVPEGSWTTTVPTPVAGKFLWTRIQIQFNTGSPITAYSVARYGIDGTGAVSSVNSVSPDATGNVQLLAADIQTLDSQSVQAHLDDAEDDIAELKTSLSNIQQHKRKIIFLGDSYGTQSESWVNYCADYMTLASSDYINKCISGGGFIYDPIDGEGGNAFLKQLQTVTADRDSYTDIVCCGGINDARGSQYMPSISTNIRAFISYAKTNFPNAKIYIGFIGSALEDSSVIGVKTYSNRMLALREYIKSSSPYYMSGIENAIHTDESNYGSDRFHPSASGANYIGLCVANSIGNNGCDVKNQLTVSLSRSNTTFSYNGITVDINNDYTTVKMNEGLQATFSAPVNIGRQPTNRIEFTITGDLFFDYPRTVESFLQITRNGVAVILPCIWYFNQKTIGVNIQSLANGSWETISTNYIFINAPVTLTFPTQMIN